MKKNFIKKLSFALATLIIFASFMTLTAFAEDYEPVKWRLSDDDTVLTNETEKIEYHRVNTGFAISQYAENIFAYQNFVDMSDGSYAYAYQNLQNMDVVWLESGYGYGYDIYVTDKGEQDLNSFLGGKIGSFWMQTDYYWHSKIPHNTIDNLDEALHSGKNKKSFEVKDLSRVEVYEILAVDENDTLSYVYGAIYKFGINDYWYVNYMELGNQYFDANGDFSYRKGSVEMTKISDAREINGIIANASYYEVQYEYERYINVSQEDDNNGILILFWVFYVLCMIVPPVCMTILGFVLPFIKKLGRPKYWYIFMAFAILWLVASIVLAVLLIVV